MKFNFEKFLNFEKQKPYFFNLANYLKRATNITPKKDRIFFAMHNFDFDNLKVIIIGQDPYPGVNVADGLCFSSNEEKTPASLKNIFAEIRQSYPNCIFQTNNLDYWKNQGVLLLNTILTNEVGKTLAHQNIGWEIFTYNFLNQINELYTNVIYLLLGNYAKKYAQKLDLRKQIIIQTSHPSPLSYFNGFKGSKVFEKINSELKKQNKKVIDWSTK